MEQSRHTVIACRNVHYVCCALNTIALLPASAALLHSKPCPSTRFCLAEDSRHVSRRMWVVPAVCSHSSQHDSAKPDAQDKAGGAQPSTAPSGNQDAATAHTDPTLWTIQPQQRQLLSTIPVHPQSSCFKAQLYVHIGAHASMRQGAYTPVRLCRCSC